MNIVVLHVQVDVSGAASTCGSHASAALRSLTAGHVGVEDGRLRVANILRAHGAVIQEHHLGLQALAAASIALLAASRIARIRRVRPRPAEDFLRCRPCAKAIVDS